MTKPEPSSCMSLTVAARRVFDFEVEGYSVVKWMTTGDKYFQSDTFSVGGCDWAVRFRYNILADTVSFYLVCLSKIKSEVGVSFLCTLLEKSGKPSATVEKRLSTKFSCCGQREGFAGFMSEKDFKDRSAQVPRGVRPVGHTAFDWLVYSSQICMYVSKVCLV